MKTFIALFALVAVAVANPLPLVQIIVNVDAPQGSITGNPVSVDGIEGSPASIDMPIIDFVPEEASYDPLPLPPIVVPEPVVLPEPELPVVVPEPIVLPEPVLPVVVPEPIEIPEPEPEAPASVPISPVVIPEPVETAPESVPISPVVIPEAEVADSVPISPITTQPQQS